MKDLRDLLTTYGVASTLGVFFVLAAPIPLIGINPLIDLHELQNLSSKQMVGLAFLAVGLVLLVWRIIQRKEETTIVDADARLLREVILPPLNRRAITLPDYPRPEDEDLRAQFSGIRDTRITLQKSQNRLMSSALRSVVTAMIGTFGDIEGYSPWEDEGLTPSKSRISDNVKEYEAWCAPAKILKHPCPPKIDGSYHMGAGWLVAQKLSAIRLLKLELERLSSVQKS